MPGLKDQGTCACGGIMIDGICQSCNPPKRKQSFNDWYKELLKKSA